jgi:hypothetical protein
MRKLQNLFLLFILIGIIVLTTSYTDLYYESWDYIPVFMKRADLENSVSYQPSGRDMENPGKIYYKTPYIYVNEKYKGVHVIDNSDPYNPQSTGFIIVPGCLDMAVKDDIMYLDNAVDLVAFDLTAKKVTKRIKNVFPEPVSPDNRTFYYYSEDEVDYVLVAWRKNR